jgi:hypothetical protein
MAATLRSFQCPVPRPGTVSSTFPVRLASTSHVEFVGRLKADLPRSTSTPGLQAHMRWVRTLGTACEYRGCMGLSPFASGVPESGLWVAFSCGSLFVDLPQSRVVLASRRQEGGEPRNTCSNVGRERLRVFYRTPPPQTIDSPHRRRKSEMAIIRCAHLRGLGGAVQVASLQ